MGSEFWGGNVSISQAAVLSKQKCDVITIDSTVHGGLHALKALGNDFIAIGCSWAQSSQCQAESAGGEHHEDVMQQHSYSVPHPCQGLDPCKKGGQTSDISCSWAHVGRQSQSGTPFPWPAMEHFLFNSCAIQSCYEQYKRILHTDCSSDMPNKREKAAALHD
jgi:hypothetical protein